MACYFCEREISPGQEHYHHLVAVADGGAEAGQTVPVHRECHHQHHRENGDYSRWRQMDYAEKVRTFGADEVHRLLAHYGRKGYAQLVATKGEEYLRDFHRRGGLARAANGRDARGRFTPVATAPGRQLDDDHLLEAF